MIELRRHPKGVVLAVRAQPRARRPGIVGEHAGALKVAVTAAPEKGKANQAILALLCAELGLESSRVVLLSGAASRDKRVLLVGADPGALRARLDRLAAPARS
jgi:hypothetical protein